MTPLSRAKRAGKSGDVSSSECGGASAAVVTPPGGVLSQSRHGGELNADDTTRDGHGDGRFVRIERVSRANCGPTPRRPRLDRPKQARPARLLGTNFPFRRTRGAFVGAASWLVGVGFSANQPSSQTVSPSKKFEGTSERGSERAGDEARGLLGGLGWAVDGRDERGDSP